jgi:hypothetical protein
MANLTPSSCVDTTDDSDDAARVNVDRARPLRHNRIPVLKLQTKRAESSLTGSRCVNDSILMACFGLGVATRTLETARDGGRREESSRFRTPISSVFATAIPHQSGCETPATNAGNKRPKRFKMLHKHAIQLVLVSPAANEDELPGDLARHFTAGLPRAQIRRRDNSSRQQVWFHTDIAVGEVTLIHSSCCCWTHYLTGHGAVASL